MAKIWVKGFTKYDGTKVKGHYREVANKVRMMEASGSVNKNNDGLYAAKGTGMPISKVTPKSPKAYQLMARYNRMKVNKETSQTWGAMMKTEPQTIERRILNNKLTKLRKLKRIF